MEKKKVDTIIVGSGQGGVPLAEALSKGGEDVVVFERALWGGCCLNYGCTPSKMFLASAHAASQARAAEELGIKADVAVDFQKVMNRLSETTSNWSNGVKIRLKDAGVTLIEEEASFTAPKTIRSESHILEADKIVINTGKSPFVPPIDGIDVVPFLTYETFWNLKELPPRIIIIGAGYVGCEIGQALARLGSEVHIIGAHDRPLSNESKQVGDILQKQMEEDGVHFYFNKHADKVRYDDDLFQVWRSDDGPIEAEFMLLAAGRKPNTKSLNSDKGNIELDEKGHIKVNDRFETSAEGVYAIGDVTGQPAFTHVSWEDHRRLVGIFNGENRTQMDRVLGYTIFTQPQIARAGLSLEQAEEQGFTARGVELPLDQVARATETGFTNGFYKMVIDDENDKILGATLISPTAGDLVHIFIDLMESGATWHVLDRAVHIHPSFAEGLPTLARKLKKN